MNKQCESERSRIEHAEDARITFTIALHGKHAWEVMLEDSHRHQSISHGWATDNPHDWEDAIAPLCVGSSSVVVWGSRQRFPSMTSPTIAPLTLPCNPPFAEPLLWAHKR